MSKQAIIGGSFVACLYAIHLNSLGHEVTILEKSNELGGAWAINNNLPKYSNIIYPAKDCSQDNFLICLKYLKSQGIVFNELKAKSLFFGQFEFIESCDLVGFYEKCYNELEIIFNYEVSSIEANNNEVIINGDKIFNKITIPSQVFVEKISYNEKKIKIPMPNFLEDYHLRFKATNFIEKNIKLINRKIKPFDRMQIYNTEKGYNIISGRLLPEYKLLDKNNILELLQDTGMFSDISDLDIFNYKRSFRKGWKLNATKKAFENIPSIEFLNSYSVLTFIQKLLKI